MQVGYHDSALQSKEAPRAPGMKYRHYSPKARVVLFEAGSDLGLVAGRVKQELRSKQSGEGSSARRIGIVRTKTWPLAIQLASDAETSSQAQETSTRKDNTLSIRQITTSIEDIPTMIYDISLGSSAESIARGLFAALRSLDAENVDAIYIEGVRDDEGDLSAAVMNRLRKAAEVFVAV